MGQANPVAQFRHGHRVTRTSCRSVIRTKRCANWSRCADQSRYDRANAAFRIFPRFGAARGDGGQSRHSAGKGRAAGRRSRADGGRYRQAESRRAGGPAENLSCAASAPCAREQAPADDSASFTATDATSLTLAPSRHAGVPGRLQMLAMGKRVEQLYRDFRAERLPHSERCLPRNVDRSRFGVKRDLFAREASASAGIS